MTLVYLSQIENYLFPKCLLGGKWKEATIGSERLKQKAMR